MIVQILHLFMLTSLAGLLIVMQKFQSLSKDKKLGCNLVEILPYMLFGVIIQIHSILSM